MDYKRALLLLLFYKPRSKYDVLLLMEDMPKSARIPQASLYRIVDELKNEGFVTLASPRPQKNRPDQTVNEYRLSLKGTIAAWIYGYVLLLDPKTPRSLMEKLNTEELIKSLESAPFLIHYLNFLKWHRQRGDDLSRVKFGIGEFMLTLLLSVLERPEDLSDREIGIMMKQLNKSGLNIPQLEPAEVRKKLEDWKSTMRALEERILALSREAQH